MIPIAYGRGFAPASKGPAGRPAAGRATLSLVGLTAGDGPALFTADVASPLLPRTVQVLLDGHTVAGFSLPPNHATYVEFTVPAPARSNALTFVSRPAARDGRALLFENVVAWPASLTTIPGVANPNLIGNGGFESDTAGWSTTAPNTIVRSTGHARTGSASGLATRNTGTDDDDVANFGVTLIGGESYVLSCWILVPPGYSGAGVQLNPEWAGATGEGSVVNLDVRGTWQRVERTFKLGSAGNGYLVVRLPGSRTGDFVYIDDLSLKREPL